MKHFVNFVTLILVSSISYAAETGPGCGMGTQMFKGEKGLGPHVMALTTNQSSSQNSAITSGTSGCEADATVRNEMKQIHFVDSNYDELISDIAKGDGLFLEAYTSLFGCKKESLIYLQQNLKENYHQFIKHKNSKILFLTKDSIRNNNYSCDNV